MKTTDIINSVTRSFSRASLKLKKHSPEILVIAGVVGVVTSAVMACKATTKVDPIVFEAKEKIDKVHDNMDRAEELGITEKDSKKALTMVYAQTGLELAKLYGPSVILGSLSIASILTSHKIIRTRNVALAAAYATVDGNFKEYRNRVIDRFGKDLDREIAYNIKSKEIEEVVVGEDGTETTVKKTINVAEGPISSPYSICFDETCVGWDRDAEANKFFLLQQQAYANDLLKTRGHVFLNEVFDMLGAQRTKAGQHVGWVYDEKNPIGDNYIDFGIFNIHSETSRAFVNGYEKSIWLEFNVDGDIQELLA